MQKKALVLVESHNLPFVMSSLKEAGFRLTIVEDFEEMRAILPAVVYDLIVCEFSAEQLFSDCIGEIHDLTTVPVLALIGNDDYTALELCLAVADDALPASASAQELMVRARTLANQPRAHLHPDENCRIFGELRLFPHKYAVANNRRPVKLTPTEYAIFMLLASHPGQVFTQSQIDAVVRNDVVEINVEKNISNHISRLRKKLKRLTQTDFILVEKSAGYYFTPPIR